MSIREHIRAASVESGESQEVLGLAVRCAENWMGTFDDVSNTIRANHQAGRTQAAQDGLAMLQLYGSAIELAGKTANLAKDDVVRALAECEAELAARRAGNILTN